MNSTVGKYLKETRESNGISIESISINTKLDRSFILQIENNTFKDIGGTGYCRAMIATISKEIGADPIRAISLFEEQFGNSKKRKKPKSFSGENKFLISNHLFSIILIVIIVAVLSSIIFTFHSKGMLENPFKADKNKTEEIETNKEKKSNKLKQETKKKKLEEDEITSIVEKNKTGNKKEKAESPKVTNISKALSDSTDYLDKLLFKNNPSPFNIKEN
ncbi:MAG: helix-turn-helix transcriptional regulator [Candidatus Cloacimonadota bacterium]|nr:helix-turn-helix transcriptional regulator [Candidatus Cloacimonadota bacterium]